MKHKPTTLQKYIRRGNAFIAFLSDMDPAEITFCVSYGNKKIGKVLNVSKAPIFTCRGVCHKCKDFCYDIKACLQYTNVMEARMRNTVIFYKDRDLFFNRIRESMNKRKFNKFLRYDVHTVTLECGYYSGIQMTAETNETGHIAASVERRRVLREIERIADEYGFFEYTSREVFDSEPLFRYA